MFGFKRSLVQLIFLLAWTLHYFTFGNLFLWYTLATLLCFASALAVTTYDHDYWISRGIFSPPAWPLVGHIKSVVLFKEQGGICFKKIYDTYKNERFLGCHQFWQRTLVVRDPDLIKRICVNDFHHFVDRGFFFNKDVDPLAGSVLFLRGSEWKKLRAKISPTFSPNKLRGMFPLIENTANEFVEHLKKILTDQKLKTNEDGFKSNTKLKQNGKINGHTNGYISENNNMCEKNEQRRINEANENTKPDFNEKTSEINNNTSSIENSRKQNDKLPTEVHEQKFISENSYENSLEVNSEKLFGGYTADAIVPCAFGLKSNVMENEKDPFAVALYAFYEMSWYNLFEKTMRQFWPAFVLFFKMRIIPKKTHDFFYNIVTSVLRARENGGQEKRGDFIDMMMALRNDDKNHNTGKEDDVEITDIVISANAFIIFLGGFETTSATLAFLMLELAYQPRVQEKMREEIFQVLYKHNGKMSYEMLQELTYMEMVIQETLRLYPPFPSIQRMCTQDYVIPGTDKVVERGTIVLFPTLGIQRDEKYFYKANEFIPERWSAGQPTPPPGVYMPFGDGPRYCIGKRFAFIQMKCCLTRVLSRVRVLPAATPRTGPVTADPRSPLTLHPLDSTLRLALL